MNGVINANRTLGRRDPMIYGHFIEHFHRQIYGGVYDPGNPLSDAEGFRQDVLEAMRRIHVPVLRWPGGCFVSSYHWKKAVGRTARRFSTKPGAWRTRTTSARMNTSPSAAKSAASPTSARTPAPAPPRR